MATLTGLPISTTHSLVGGLVGVGLAASDSIAQQNLLNSFLFPLILSPLVALVLAVALYKLSRWLWAETAILRRNGGHNSKWGIPLLAVLAKNSLPNGNLRKEEVGRSVSGQAIALPQENVLPTLDRVHFVSAGVVSFARGLNDTPKIVALLAVLPALDMRWGLLVIATVMAAGGLLNARRVAKTMAYRITSMSHGQGVAANITTGFLVIIASLFGLPVSTTHVAVGSLFGIGLLRGTACYRSIGQILLAWVVTLPCAGIIAASVYQDLTTVTETELAIVMDKLNNRPRKSLGFRTPHEVFNDTRTSLTVALRS